MSAARGKLLTTCYMIESCVAASLPPGLLLPTGSHKPSRVPRQLLLRRLRSIPLHALPRRTELPQRRDWTSPDAVRPRRVSRAEFRRPARLPREHSLPPRLGAQSDLRPMPNRPQLRRFEEEAVPAGVAFDSRGRELLYTVSAKPERRTKSSRTHLLHIAWTCGSSSDHSPPLCLFLTFP